MARPESPTYARALLFDRLVDREPQVPAEPRPWRALTRQELYDSVQREVGRLLNTYCPRPAHRLDDCERSVINYGVPDFSRLSPHSEADQRRLAHLLSRTIAAFEPRLRQVRVTVEQRMDDRKALSARVDAVLVVESVVEPITFLVVVHPETGASEVYDGT
jgi:type VI secretion system protein ImpF